MGMAEPSSWVAPTDIWDPLANQTPAGGGDWVEEASPREPGGGEMWARDDASVTLVGHIPYKKAYDARRKILGYAYADTGSPWALHRVNPLPHPRERHLSAVTCDIIGINPWAVAQPDASTAAGYPAPYLDPAPAAGTILLPRISTYSRALCTIKFKPHPYPFVTDATMVSNGWNESYRNCAIFDSIDPVLEVLLTQSDPFLVWADAASSGAPAVGQTINAQLPEYIQKATYVAIWYHVPYEFVISSSTGFQPTKLMDGVGHVNSATWNGFPAGTIRFEAPRFRKAVQAVIRTDPTVYYVPYVYDIVLPFTWVDPTPAPILGGGSPTYRGWNMLPFSNTGKWYAAKRQTNGDPYFPTYDFNKLFQHVGA